MVEIKLSLIRTDGGTQMRAKIQEEVYLDYRDKWLEGVKFDPVDVFYDGTTYWLGDGFHRFYGAREAKLEKIPANIHQGTQRDAILFAAGANATHGLRRSNADKRRAVETLLNDPEWVKWSDNKIAEQAAVSVQFVSNIRKELSTVDNSPAAKTANEPRVGRDGKSYPKKKKRSETGNPASVSSEADPFDVDPFGEEESARDPKPETGGGESRRQTEVAPPADSASKPDPEKQFREQRSKTVKTVEALMRAFDDLHRLRKHKAHAGAINACRNLLQTAKTWQ